MRKRFKRFRSRALSTRFKKDN